MAKNGFRLKDAARRGGPLPKHAPLPASAAAKALCNALAASTTQGLQRYGLVAVRFLLFTRPTSLRHMSKTDVHVPETYADIKLNILNMLKLVFGQLFHCAFFLKATAIRSKAYYKNSVMLPLIAIPIFSCLLLILGSPSPVQISEKLWAIF